MKKAELGQRIQHELRGMIRLSPFVVALLVVMTLLWRFDSVANSGLFQSSPVQTPATSTPTREVTATATSTQQPTVSPSPDATGTTETSTAAPTESVVPVETPSPEVTSAPTELPVTDTPVSPASSETMEPEATADEGNRYPEGESNLKFEWGMLFDSLALFFSYAWLFCGILLFISVPLLFFLLWRSSSQRQEEATPGEDMQEQSQQEEK